MPGLSGWNTWQVAAMLLTTTVVLGMSLTMGRIVQRDRPLRHTVLLAGLWSVYAIPVMVACFDWIGVSLLRVELAGRFQGNLSRTSADATVPAVDRIGPPPVRAKASRSAMSEELRLESLIDATDAAPKGVPAVAIAEQPPAHSTLAALAWRVWLAFASVWAVGTVLRAFGLVRSLLKLRRIVRGSTHLTNARVVRVAEEVRGRLRLRRPLAVLESDGVQGPVAVGLVGNGVILPVAMSGSLSDAELRAVLLHEAAHLQRRDHWVVLAQEILASAFWFNPVVHWFNRELIRAREEVCDNHVLDVLDSVSYCDLLLRLSRAVASPPRLLGALSISGVRGKLEERVASILDERRTVMTRVSTRAAFVIGTVFLLASALAGAFTLAVADEPATSATDNGSAAAAPAVDAAGTVIKRESEGIAIDSDSEGIVVVRGRKEGVDRVVSAAVAADKELSAEDEELDLAQRLVVTQEELANYKRVDLVEEGMGPQIRPKFAEALKRYEGLRKEVIRRHVKAMMNNAQPRRDGHELLFNGATSYVELPTLKYDGQVPYTIEATVSPAPISGFKINPEIHSYAHYMAIATDTEFGGIELGLLPDRFTFDVCATQLPPGVKHFGRYVRAEAASLPFVEEAIRIAAVLEKDEIRLYKNGKCVARSAFGGPVGTSPYTMRIGCSPHPVTECHEMFCGRIDEVRFSESARYDDDYKPKERLELDEDVVALYHFDEGKGDEVRDESPNKHHGIVHDARWVPVGTDESK